jgi:hypothetical protein
MSVGANSFSMTVHCFAWSGLPCAGTKTAQSGSRSFSATLRRLPSAKPVSRRASFSAVASKRLPRPGHPRQAPCDAAITDHFLSCRHDTARQPVIWVKSERLGGASVLATTLRACAQFTMRHTKFGHEARRSPAAQHVTGALQVRGNWK